MAPLPRLVSSGTLKAAHYFLFLNLVLVERAWAKECSGSGFKSRILTNSVTLGKLLTSSELPFSFLLNEYNDTYFLGSLQRAEGACKAPSQPSN